MFGPRPLGRPLAEVLPELAGSDLAPLRRVLTTGVPVEVLHQPITVRDAAGASVSLTYVLAPLGRSGKAPAGVVITAIDVTAEAQAKEAIGRARLRYGLSARLTAASDATSGLQALADALVPNLADVAAVYVLPGSADRAGLTEPIPPQVIAIADALASLRTASRSSRSSSPAASPARCC